MPKNNHLNDWILHLFGGPNEAGKCEMKVSLFCPESQKFTESWFVFIPFRYRSNDVSKKSRGLVGRGLGWRQVGSIPPISNFIPLPSHQEVYCNSASNLNISMSQWPISASGYSNLKIGIFKFEYPNVSMVNLGFGIFKFENRDFQIWKSGFSNLNIKMMLFKI